MSEPQSPPTDLTSRRELVKVIIAAFVGTVIEWYDFFLYNIAAALVFNTIFFPNEKSWIGTFYAFATSAVGFFFRPLGGIIFGYVGDKYGRKVSLVWTLGLMGVTTFLVGCLPTFATAGIWAPVMLVLLRIGQGIAVGGEWGGAALLTVEHGHRGNRGFYGSWTQAGVPMGFILANLAFTYARPNTEWGWRVPFWFGIALTLVGFLIRRHMRESPLFEQAVANKVETHTNPLANAIRTNWRNVLFVIGARLAENASYYVITAFLISYAKVQLKLPDDVCLKGLLIGAGVELVMMPIFGRLSDRFGRRAICLFGTITLMLFAFPLFMLVDTKDTLWIRLAFCFALGISHAAMYAPQAAFFSELFGTRVRFSGVSMGYQLTAPLAGGVALLICPVLLEWNGNQPWLVAGYLVLIGLISTLTVLFSLETSKRDMTA